MGFRQKKNDFRYAIGFVKWNSYKRIMAVIRTPSPPTNIVDFGGFDSSTILIWRGGIPRHVGDSPEMLTQAILVGTMLVGRLGVLVLQISGLFEFQDYSKLKILM